MYKNLAMVVVFLMISCSVKQSAEVTQKELLIEDIAFEYFAGKKYAIKTNISESHSLVFKKYKKLEDLFPDIHFFVFDHESKSIIFSDELKAGSVKWHSDYKIIAVARNLPIENSNNTRRQIYHYDVRAKQKTIIE